MSAVLFLFLVHLGLGIAGTLLLVGPAAGAKFFRFTAGLSCVLLLTALAVRPDPLVAAGMDAVGMSALIAAASAMLVYWASIGRGLAALRPALMWVAVLGGGVAVLVQGIALAPADIAAGPALTVLSMLTSAALLGGACTAMILGHWYLVMPSMDVALLQRIVRFHIGSTVLRTVVVGVVVAAALLYWESPSGAGYAQYVWSLDGVFLWQRVLFGLGSPAVLSYLTWETAKIRSTQSATGILYVDFFTVVVGEAIAKYLLLATGVPV